MMQMRGTSAETMAATAPQTPVGLRGISSRMRGIVTAGSITRRILPLVLRKKLMVLPIECLLWMLVLLCGRYFSRRLSSWSFCRQFLLTFTCRSRSIR